MSDLTQEKLKLLLHYNYETGVFTRLVSSNKSVKIGDTAGTISHGYIIICVQGKYYRAHRLAWLYVKGVWPENQIDHDNHVRSDNRWVNLFEVTNQENHKNMSLSAANTSGVTGVVWNKRRAMWQAQIKIYYKCIFLGCYEDKFEAICSRLSANNKYGFHGNHGLS